MKHWLTTEPFSDSWVFQFCHFQTFKYWTLKLSMLFPWEFFPARTTVIFGSVAQDYNAALREEGNQYKQAT